MIAGRIEGLALSFIAGIFSAYLARLSVNTAFLPSGLCAILIISIVLSIKQNKHRVKILTVIYFVTGILCFIASDAIENYQFRELSKAERLIDTLSHQYINQIDEIPFKNGNNKALVKALISGDRSELSSETKDVFRSSGASHLLALSGMHLGILYSILLILLYPLGNNPRLYKWKALIIMLIATVYTLICGASPSLVRALLFIYLNEAHKLLGRRKSAVRTLAIAMMIQLIISPQIISSISFQLSYLAMCGITLIYPKMQSWYPKVYKNELLNRIDIPRKIWEISSLSVSCQIFTAPLAWILFGTFPKYFLMTNMFAAPLTTVIMILSFICLSLSMLGCCPGAIIAWNEKTVSTLIKALTVISEM